MKRKSKFSYVFALLMLAFLMPSNEILLAQEVDTIAQEQTTTSKEKKEKKDKEKKEDKKGATNEKTFVVDKTTVQIVSVSFFVIMLVLIGLFFRHIKERQQYLGFQSIKYIGLVLMFPGICILALVGGSSLIPGSTLAALLGTIAGYVLSRERDDDSFSEDTAALKKQNKALEKSKAKLLKEIKALKEQLAGD